MNWDKVSEELRKPLDPKNVKPAPRGKYGDYVDIHHVIEEANRIFGFNGWSYVITRVEKVSEQLVELKGSNGPYEQARVGYMATVQVTVDGVTREGAAVGSGVGSPNTLADHHESALKEAESDALKRALRTFGNTFGLALYDKTQANVGDPNAPQPIDSKAVTDRIIMEIDDAANVERLAEIRTTEAETLNAITDDDFARLKAAFAARKTELTQKEAA